MVSCGFSSSRSGHRPSPWLVDFGNGTRELFFRRYCLFPLQFGANSESGQRKRTGVARGSMANFLSLFILMSQNRSNVQADQPTLGLFAVNQPYSASMRV